MPAAEPLPRVAPRELPHSVDAEQALLGILLYDSEAVHQLPPNVVAESFFERLHRALFDAITGAAHTGLRADPISLAEELRGDPAFKETGGVRYLAMLVDRAPPTANMATYCEVVADLSTRRQLIALAGNMLAAAHEFDQVDGGATRIISHAEQDLLAMQLTDRKLELMDAAKAASSVLAWVDNPDTHIGAYTGLNPLDLQLGPLLPGDLVLVGGRPSMGKSALASSIALRVAAPQWWPRIVNGRDYDLPELTQRQLPEPAGVIELNGEMSEAQMARRHISDIGFHLFGSDFPTYKAIRDRRVSATQRQMMDQAAAVFAAMPVKMLKRTGLRISQLRSIVRRQTGEWHRRGVRVGLVVVDHVGLLRPEGKTAGRYEAQMEIAIAMKELADELGCPVMALIQLSREVERRDDKRPQLSDLRDAGGWEENADTVLFPYRDAYYAAREKEPDAADLMKWDQWDRRRKSKTVEVIIGKLREGEGGQSAELWGGMAWNAIRGIAPEWGDLV